MKVLKDTLQQSSKFHNYWVKKKYAYMSVSTNKCSYEYTHMHAYKHAHIHTYIDKNVSIYTDWQKITLTKTKFIY